VHRLSCGVGRLHRMRRLSVLFLAGLIMSSVAACTSTPAAVPVAEGNVLGERHAEVFELIETRRAMPMTACVSCW